MRPPIYRALSAPPSPRAAWMIVLLLLTLSTTGCEEDVSPFIGTEFPFTVWGVINPKADTQAVRVFTIDETLKLIPTQPLDAVVSIIDVEQEERFVLKDSVVVLNNGDARHTFWSSFDVEFGQLYRVEVERSDGAITKSTEIRVPGPVSLEAVDPDVNAVRDLLLPVVINGNPPSLPRIDARYNAVAVDAVGNPLESLSVVISYSTQAEFRDGTWILDIDLREDFVRIRNAFNELEVFGFICTDELTVDVHVGNEEWRSPIGVFDPNFLVEPGTLSNVENGFGFFGAGFIERITLVPPIILLVRAGFADCTLL